MDPNGAECMFELYHTVPHPLTTGNTRRQRVLQANSTDLWENFSWANRTQFGANLAWIILEALLQVETNLIFTNFYLSRNPTITLNQSQRLKSRQPHVLTFLKHTRAPLFTPSVYLTTAFKYLPPKEKYLSLRSFPYFFSPWTLFFTSFRHTSRTNEELGERERLLISHAKSEVVFSTCSQKKDSFSFALAPPENSHVHLSVSRFFLFQLKNTSRVLGCFEQRDRMGFPGYIFF